jgi:hypothetical protein
LLVRTNQGCIQLMELIRLRQTLSCYRQLAILPGAPGFLLVAMSCFSDFAFWARRHLDIHS